MNTTDHFRTVTTQAELDQALDDGVIVIDVRSNPGVWLSVRDASSSTVRAWGTSTVIALGSSTVEAWGTSTVTAYDTSTVEAWGSATVRAYDTSAVTAWGSATVRAWGSATVRAYDTSTVRAWGSAIVEAWDSAAVTALESSTVTALGSSTVEAWGTSTVTAWGSATVRAYDTSTVRAWGSAIVRASGSSAVTAWGSATVEVWGTSTVRASSRVAVHLHSGRATTVTGGVVIDHTQEPSDPVAWCAWHDVPVTDGKAVLHKAVGEDWTTGADWDHRPVYAPGAELEAPDWRDDHHCGGGLHFSPRTWEARSYHLNATRFVAVEVDVADMRPILGPTPKAKAPRCRVLYEVNIDGKPVGGESDE